MQTEDQELNYFLKPGSIFTCWQPYRIATVLGSCVSVCLSDTVNKISGMNNIALPKKKGEVGLTKFANYSIPQLLEMMFELGADKRNIEAHIVGGSYSKKYSTRDIGKETVKEAKKILKKYKIPVVNDDTGGTFGRKVLFDTNKGEIIVYKSRDVREKDWYGYKSIDHR
jgi:chemotaxis protein CheD